MVSKRHKVFISYHHDKDQKYADKLREYYGESKAIIDKSMREDLSHLEIETILRKIRQDYLKDSTVTVVLIGKHTWGRKWVDWEIHASLRPYMDRTINGLVGIFLPGHSDNEFRLTDNIESSYAVELDWNEVETEFINAVHTAWNRRNRPELIDNSRDLRERNAPLEPKQYSSGGGSDCFIATAAYGTPLAIEIDILQLWRDKKLKNSCIGRSFINLYYLFSPSIANIIKTNEWIKAKIRRLITVFIKNIKTKEKVIYR